MMDSQKVTKAVTPAKAGVQTPSLRKQGTILKTWIPAFAGMTKMSFRRLFTSSSFIIVFVFV
jgi:hypothetical protein